MIFLLFQNSLVLHIRAMFRPDNMGKTGIRKTTRAGSKITHSTPRDTEEMEGQPGARRWGVAVIAPKSSRASPHCDHAGCSTPCKQGMQAVLQGKGTRGHSYGCACC